MSPKNLFIATIMLFLLFGCAQKSQILTSKSLIFTAITPTMRINDTGFMHSYNDGVNLQIYSSGASVLNLDIGKKICTNKGCKNQKAFNQEFFKNSHYEGFFMQILQQKPIYDGINLTKTDCGFEQNISKFFIKYTVCRDKVSFNDTKNRIKIMIKELN